MPNRRSWAIVVTILVVTAVLAPPLAAADDSATDYSGRYLGEVTRHPFGSELIEILSSEAVVTIAGANIEGQEQFVALVDSDHGDYLRVVQEVTQWVEFSGEIEADGTFSAPGQTFTSFQIYSCEGDQAQCGQVEPPTSNSDGFPVTVKGSIEAGILWGDILWGDDVRYGFTTLMEGYEPPGPETGSTDVPSGDDGETGEPEVPVEEPAAAAADPRLPDIAQEIMAAAFDDRSGVLGNAEADLWSVVAARTGCPFNDFTTAMDLVDPSGPIPEWCRIASERARQALGRLIEDASEASPDRSERGLFPMSSRAEVEAGIATTLAVFLSNLEDADGTTLFPGMRAAEPVIMMIGRGGVLGVEKSQRALKRLVSLAIGGDLQTWGA